MRGTRPPPPAGSGAAPPGISGSALRLGLRRGARQAAAAAAARRGGGTGGGRGRGTVGLGRLSLYLLLLPSPCLALTLPLSFSPPLFPAASGYRFPSFYRYDWFRVPFYIFACWFYFLLLGCCRVSLACRDSSEGRAFRDAGFLAFVLLSRGTHHTLDLCVSDYLCWS